MSNVCVAVCTYNRYDKLDLAIESITRQNIPKNSVDIIVIDNTPPHQRTDHVKKKYSYIPRFKYIYEDIPGLSNARNVATLHCEREIIAYLDDDAIASPDWVEEIQKAFDIFPKTGVVGGRIIPLWEVEKPEWLCEELYGYLSIVDWGGGVRVAANEEWFAGANIAFQTTLLKKYKFDLNLGRNGSGGSLLSNEESKLIDEIVKAGYVRVYCPGALVHHLIPESRLKQRWFRKRVVWQAISDYIKDGEVSEERAAQHYSWFLDYMWASPPAERTLAGISVPKSGPRDFRNQLSAIYNYTMNMLGGYS